MAISLIIVIRGLFFFLSQQNYCVVPVKLIQSLDVFRVSSQIGACLVARRYEDYTMRKLWKTPCERGTTSLFSGSRFPVAAVTGLRVRFAKEHVMVIRVVDDK
ncbi:hypothetical protein H2203_005170 [Taxawa tesnikishii (nom. ined.)]|nr:hypothetical protein H2203_005170 [Dothideales sp. JES 119]